MGRSPLIGRILPRILAGFAGGFLLWLSAAVSAAEASSTLPTGFNEQVLAQGLPKPYQLAFAPDERLFISLQAGKIRIIEDGVLLPTPFLSLTVDSRGDRGLIGMAFDPDFETNHWVYVFYTAPAPVPHQRVSRFRAVGNVADPGSEDILIETEGLGSSVLHQGGSLDFGPDGKLYVTVGDNVQTAKSQSMSTLLGKVLRLNPDGSIPTDNPFYGSATGVYRAIWARGLRNPYTADIDANTGRYFINDVGASTWEEIDQGTAGANYGWPTEEGVGSDPRFTDPIYAYHHGSGAFEGCAIVGAGFYDSAAPQFPSSYTGDYFFGDYCGAWIHVFDSATNAVAGFASNLDGLVDADVGPDGSLYYLARTSTVGGVARKISFSNQPAIAAGPKDVAVSVGQPASFTVDANGVGPLTYQWQRDGIAIPGAMSASYTLASASSADNGARLRVVVSNANGSVTSTAATLTVTNNHRPVATIVAPGQGTTYAGGNVIFYSGTGVDDEDGTLPASAFSWTVVFHHETHTHPFIGPINGVKSGSFTIPRTGETDDDVWYRIHLTVTDSAGATATTARDVRPRTTTVTLQTIPVGLSLTLDGQPVATPRTFVGVEGMNRTLGAPSQQTIGGLTYVFRHWSDGGAAVHQIVTPVGDTTYTATYVTRSNVLKNGGFEADATGDGKPDNWTPVAQVSRSGSVVHGGAFAIRHTAQSNASYVVAQTPKVTAATSYHFSGWVNIPATADSSFTFAIQIRWRDAADAIIKTSAVRSFTAPTGWANASADLVAPAQAASASVRMVVTGLTGTVYADDFTLSPL
jgi:glucose/arabinose dehydrogenase